MYEIPLEMNVELIARIVAASDVKRNTPEIFGGSDRIMYVDITDAVGGSPFEQLL